MPQQSTIASRLNLNTQTPLPQAVSIDTKAPPIVASTEALTSGLSGAAILKAVAGGLGDIYNNYFKGKEDARKQQEEELGHSIKMKAATGQLSPKEMGALAGVQIGQGGAMSFSTQDPNAGALSDVRLKAANQGLINSTPVDNRAFPSAGVKTGVRYPQVNPALPVTDPLVAGLAPLPDDDGATVALEGELPQESPTDSNVPVRTAADEVAEAGLPPSDESVEWIKTIGDEAYGRVKDMPGWLWVAKRQIKPGEPSGKFIRDYGYQQEQQKGQPVQIFDSPVAANQFLAESKMSGMITPVNVDGTVKYSVGAMKPYLTGSLKVTEGQSKIYAFHQLAKAAESQLERISDFDMKSLDGALARVSGDSEFKSWLASSAGVLSSGAQQYASASLAFLEAIGRNKSGAAISASEWQQWRAIYFPMPGDPPVVVKNKKELRDTELASLRKVLPDSLFADEKATASPGGNPAPALTAKDKAEIDAAIVERDAGRLSIDMQYKLKAAIEKFGYGGPTGR